MSVAASSNTTVCRKRSFGEVENSSPSVQRKEARRPYYLYIHAETTGLEATSKTAEIALKLFNSTTNQVVDSFTSFVKLNDAQWETFSQEAQACNGITRQMTDTGRTQAAIDVSIKGIFRRHRLDPSTVSVVCCNPNFEKTYVKQAWKYSVHMVWKDLAGDFKKAVNDKTVSSIPGKRIPKHRDAMAVWLNMTKVPKPHSAMTVVNHLMAMHHHLLKPNDRPPYFMMPTYHGQQLQRDMSQLFRVTSEDDETQVMLNGEVDFQKGSEEWKAWQAGGLSASDVPCIMNKWSYGKKSNQLWQEKTGQVAEAEPTAAQKRGLDLEEPAREAFTAATGIELRPIGSQHPEKEWLRVSVNGITNDGKGIVDCICPGSDSYENARNGKLIDFYLYKMQALLAACPTAEYAIAWIWDPVKGGLPIKIMPDPLMQEEILMYMEQFWESVQENKPPVVPVPAAAQVQDEEPDQGGFDMREDDAVAYRPASPQHSWSIWPCPLGDLFSIFRRILGGN